MWLPGIELKSPNALAPTVCISNGYPGYAHPAGPGPACESRLSKAGAQRWWCTQRHLENLLNTENAGVSLPFRFQFSRCEEGLCPVTQ